MTDYTKMDGPTLVNSCGADAYKWAEAFCQHRPDANVDEGDMVGWFANAIMTALDIQSGNVINGEHAQWLIDHGKSPRGDE